VGMVLRKRNILVGGWGVNDANYNVVTELDGKQLMCPIYSTWKAVIKRAKSDKFKEKFPTYKEASITEKWKHFSSFKTWMEAQDWEGLDLDKDVLIVGNKHYSEETCAFIPHEINTILRLRKSNSINPLGVVFNKNPKQMKSQLTKPYMGRVNSFGNEAIKQSHLGMFETPQEAHKAWQWEKANQIEKSVAWYSLQKCFRSDVAEALTNRVWKLRLEHSENKETTYL
jgi:hypothetical protein